MLGLSVSYDVINPETHEVEHTTTAAQSLLTMDGIRFMFTGVVQNFMNFNAVGVIIVAMVGVGVAEDAGLVKALIRKLVIVTPGHLLTYVLVFVGILSSIAADAGYLVLIPLAGAAFITVGRHPLAGLAAAFAAVAAAFLVNILIVPVDGILTEITNDAIHLVNPTISIDLAANVWFSIASVVMLTIVIALITEKIVEPRLGEYRGDYIVPGESALSVEEYRGLRFALYGLIGVIVFIALMTLPPGAPLRNPETGAIIGNSPFMNSLIVTIALLFFTCGVGYGIGARTMKGTIDIVNAMTKAIGSLSGLILLLLVISQFLAYFNYSNMATLAADLARRRAGARQSQRDLAAGRLRDRRLHPGSRDHRRDPEMGDLRAGLRAAPDAPERRAGSGPRRLPGRRLADQRDHPAQRLLRNDRHLRAKVPERRRRRDGDRADAALHPGDVHPVADPPGGLVSARPALGPGVTVARSMRAARAALWISEIRASHGPRPPGVRATSAMNASVPGWQPSAGSSMTKAWRTKGATGFGARLLVDPALNFAPAPGPAPDRHADHRLGPQSPVTMGRTS